jgi:tRNA nucleotidyltransferase/poly(A) polymerase
VTRDGAGHERPRTDARDVYREVAAIVGPVYLVGGSVRDLLMDRPCDDYDFATPLRPDEVEAAVRAAGRRPYLTGKRFGTVGFSVSGHKVEVTTFRAESYVGGSRRPDVEYLDDLGDDLGRRDFTVNAMALHGDAIIDPYGGQTDIAARILRAVGDPADRFAEDPLRMLRAARFASQLGFRLDPATEAAIRAGAHHLLRVARERRSSELDKLLTGESVAEGLRLLEATGLLVFLVPELALQPALTVAGRGRTGTLWEQTIEAVAATPADTTQRWAALLRDVAVPYLSAEGTIPSEDDRPAPGRADLGGELAERIGLDLRWPVARRDAVRALVASP